MNTSPGSMRDNSPDVGNHGEVEVPVGEDTLKHTFANLGAFPDAVVLHACKGELLLLLLEPPDAGAGGQTWKEEETGNGNREADDTIYNEHPAPGRREMSD